MRIAKEVNLEELKNLNHLRDLYLSLNEGFDPIALAPNDRRIVSNVLSLNALEPPQDLEKLRISYYRGTTMSPIWLASLTNLKELCLYYAT